MTPFHLVDAHSAADAVMLLQALGPRAQVIASGGDLLGLRKEGVEGSALPRADVLVNLATAADLHGLTDSPDGVRIGSMTTLAALAAHSHTPPMLAQAVGHVASPQLRAVTRLGGNLLQRPRCLYFRHPDITCFKKGGTGCPAVAGPREAYPGALFPSTCHAGHPSDLASPLIALGAVLELLGPQGARTVLLEALFEGAGERAAPEVALRSGEVLLAVRVPPGVRRQAFEKVAPRSANEFATANVAIALQCQGERITQAKVVLGGVSPAPRRCLQAEALLTGQRLAEVDAQALASAALEGALGGAQGGNQHLARLAACRVAIQRAVLRLQ
jgi:xanthine dehydrogenase YagS FAD-binding subunit